MAAKLESQNLVARGSGAVIANESQLAGYTVERRDPDYDNPADHPTSAKTAIAFAASHAIQHLELH